MKPIRSARRANISLAIICALLAVPPSGCAMGGAGGSAEVGAEAGGPADQGAPLPQRGGGDMNDGRDMFRFETFGNEGFWTDAVRMPAGVAAARVTPLQALQLGLSVDVDALDAATRAAVAGELRLDPTGRTSPLMNDPMTLVKIINANAVIGLPIKDSNGDGVMDVMRGDKVGASCALCHGVTDGSVLSVPNGGSIGRRVDGPAVHNINIGKLFATAANSRALYPVLQLSLAANGGKTLGRAPQGLTETSSEAAVDAYLSNPSFYPVGMFDDTFDGNGDPMHNTPFFRQDLAAPYGSEGMIARLDNFSNLVYTGLFDQTTLTTPGGRALLHKLGGAAGDEIADDYVKVLAATGVTGYPYVRASAHPNPGSEDAPLGIRVDDRRLVNLNTYVMSLQAPPGARGNEDSQRRGREVFRTSTCTQCHNMDQSRPVPTTIIAMNRIFPGDMPVILAQRTPPLNPVQDTPGNFFDDKMAVVNASLRGEKRGNALPLLLDLARKPVFLHDNSVATLDDLFNPNRGSTAPHPFYIPDAARRADLATYLRSLDTSR